MKTVIQAELPPQLVSAAKAYIADGWAPNFDALLAEALRTYLESHSSSLAVEFIREDVAWGLRGND